MKMSTTCTVNPSRKAIAGAQIGSYHRGHSTTEFMAAGTRSTAGFRPDKLGDFLEVAYDLDADDQSWLAAVMESARAVCGRGGPAHGGLYDASDVSAFRVSPVHVVDLSDEGIAWIRKGLELITTEMVVRTFRRILAGTMRRRVLPEMAPMIDGLRSLGYPNAININGLDPSGRGIFFALWSRELGDPSPAEMAFYRRMAHHLGAAHRCRQRLRAGLAAASSPDATDGAEAILDTRGRILHATGPAVTRSSRLELIEVADARDRARTRKRKGDITDNLARWTPLTQARWTLVDSFDRNGTRYIVARENQSQACGLASLTDRERQVVAYLAVGQSTKETAYALGISSVTVRVLISRAATKLGVRSRHALLEHADIRPLRPDANERSAFTSDDSDP